MFRKYTIAWERMKSNLKFEKLSHEKDKELYNLKQQFFANISHEIRTPVTLIISSINRLFDKGELLESKQIRSANTIRKNSNVLFRLVNELLDIRKFETNEIQINVSQVEFISYCKEIYLSFIDSASDRNIDYTFKTKVSKVNVWFDKNQFEKVISNLLSNAFKFTKNGGEIEVQIENNEDEIYFKVKDSGIGIPKTHITKIFDRFYQVNKSESDKNSGFGLGLPITKEIVLLHGGTITVESENNIGSIFTVKILKSKKRFSDEQIDEDNAVISQETLIVQELKKRTAKKEVQNEAILIVEDNEEIQDLIKDILSKDYQVLQAYNGQEGLKMATKNLPDLIISDVMMPIMDGLEFVKKLKMNTLTSHIPIIILTARSLVKNRMEGFETGADEYITKPFEEGLLKIRIANLLNNRKLLREKFINDNLLKPGELAISSPDQLFLEKLYKSFEKNLESNNLKAQLISKEIGMSYTAMYKKIKALTGLSYIEFIRDYRLSIAKQLIDEFGYSVSDACYKVGYSDRKYFSKLFKEKFKRNPSDFSKS